MFKSFGVLVLADDELNIILEKVREMCQPGSFAGYFVEISEDGFEMMALSKREMQQMPQAKRKKHKGRKLVLKRAI